MSSAAEFSRPFKIDSVPGAPVKIAAEDAERAALAQRFDIPAIHALSADVEFEQDGAEVRASGTLRARFDQLCAVSGEPFTASMEEKIGLLFLPEERLSEFDPEDEIELAAEEPDEIAYHGQAFDLGEAVAQSFGLALDPFAEGPDADAIRQQAGIVRDDEVMREGPLAAALSALKKG